MLYVKILIVEIKNSKFIKSLTNLKDIPTGDVPEIAFVGKSNVGKSSLLNSLLKSRLAKTSSTPGRTRLINYFSINDDSLRFVDLPGYGYNKASKQESEKWNEMIGSYLLNNKNLKLTIFIVDIRHLPTALDKQTQMFLHNNAIPFLIVATKGDKLAKSKVNNNVSMIARSLMVTSANIIPYSSQNAFGRNLLLDKIETFLQAINTQN